MPVDDRHSGAVAAALGVAPLTISARWVRAAISRARFKRSLMGHQSRRNGTTPGASWPRIIAQS